MSPQKHARNIFLAGVFLSPLVHAWVTTCPSNNHFLSAEWTSPRTTTSSALSMVSDGGINGSSSPSEENDGIDEDLGSRQHRLAKAQAEIDRILNNPIDPPFDFEKEMKKVTSITPPLIKEGSAEFQLEEQVSEAEEQLYKAIKAKDYETAAKKSTEISQTHVDDCGLVLQANSAFYRAFSDKDVREMESLWLKDPSCICIHPSFKPLTGVTDIMSTWKRMFESSVGSFQRTWIDPCEIQLTVKATTAVVTCVEDVYARRFVRGKRRKSELVNKLMATNIFRKVGGRWYMTYHHSSWHADSEAAKRALKSQSKGTTTRSAPPPPRRSLPSDLFGGTSMNLRRNSRRNRDDNDDDDDDSGEDRSEMDSILGIENFGPVMGDDSEGKQDGDAGGPKMDFLKDLGGLDGLLGMGGSDGTGLPPGSIIRIAKINNGNDVANEDGDDMDDYDEDEDDYDIVDDDDEEEEEEDRTNSAGKSILDLLGEKKKATTRNVPGKLSAKVLRSKCIDALRKLANDGRISPKQKRVLLTDIISCSARGEPSLVEHAYKLLCVDPTDEDAAEEDFVDQCQVFAQAFFEV